METTPSNPEQESALPLECQIEAQPEYALGKPITVKGLLHNSGAASLWILRRNTFLQPHCGDCLLVTRNGSSVPYIGISVFHGAPSAESYLRIPAGESVEAQIDLSENYAIREAGDYEISCRLPVLGTVDEGDAKPPESSAQLKLALIESKKATFRIAGSGSTLLMTRPEIANLSSSPEILNLSSQVNYRSDPQTPLFHKPNDQEKNLDYFNDQEKQDYFNAYRVAYQKIVASLKRLSATMGDRLYDLWFEGLDWDPDPLVPGRSLPPSAPRPGWEKRREDVIDALTKMANHMQDKQTEFLKQKSGCPDDWGAYTAYNGIWLCPKAFDNFWLWWEGNLKIPPDNAWARAFLVVHEISHLTAFTKDSWYDWGRRQHDPNQAVVNAQSYALFAMGADTSQSPYVPEGQINLKTGDQIWLRADTGYPLAVDPSSHYLVAAARHPTTVFTVFVDNRYPSSIMLQTSWEKEYLYLPDGTNQIESSATPQGGEEWSRFKVGEFEDHKNEKFLVLQARNGNLLCRNNENAICADRHDVDPTCLFQLIKV